MAGRRSTGRIVLNIFGAVIHIFLNIIFYIAVVYVITKASQYAADFAYQVFGSVSVTQNAGTSTEIIISKGDSTMKVAGDLESKGLIKNKYSFYVRAKLTKQNILHGTYKVSSDMDYDEIFKVITTPSRTTESNTNG